MDNVRISDLIAPAFYNVHRDLHDGKHSEYWLRGGRGSGKSSFISIEIVQGMVRDPKANAIVYRKVADTLKNTVYSQIVWAINKLCLGPWFKCKVSPMEIIYTPTGQRILFRGADDPMKSKGLVLVDGYFKYLWFEELTEFNGMIDDVETIKTSVIRGGEAAYTFYSYNPPKSANNWTNVEALVPKPGRLEHSSDYRGVPPQWLGPSFLANVEAIKATNEQAYRHVYLGEITGTGGQVFDNLVIRPITNDEINSLGRAYHGLDFGFAIDPDAYIKAGYEKRGRSLFLYDEYGGTHIGFDRLAEEVRKRSGIDKVVCDCHFPREIKELLDRGVQTTACSAPPGSVNTTSRWLQELGSIVIDPARCPNAAREFSAYEYAHDRFGMFRADYPDKDNHWIDGTRYCTEPLRSLGFGWVSSPKR